MSAHCCHSKPEKLQVDKKLTISLLVLSIVLLISFLPSTHMAVLNESLLSYLTLIWWAVLLGLFLGGVIDYFIPEQFIYSLLGEKSFKSIINAVIAGFLLSACSHGMLALAIQLHKKGASIAAVITFLLASPWANLPMTVLLFSFFGWQALLFILAAMLVAVVTGIIYMALEHYQLIESSPEVDQTQAANWDKVKNFNLQKSIQGVSRGILQLANMVLWWIIIGILIAAVIGAFVPHHIFMDYFGPSLSGLIMTLLVATVIEVCSEGSSPIAFEIYKNIGALGNPFVFLMAGVVTDYTEIGLLWSNIGKKTALWLPVITVPQVLLIGYLFNFL